jgi:hypothetical protein
MLWKSQRVLALGILGLAMYCRGLLLQGMCLVSLSITILTMAWSPQVAADNGHNGDPSIVVDARLDMTCLPPPPPHRAKSRGLGHSRPVCCRRTSTRSLSRPTSQVKRT